MTSKRFHRMFNKKVRFSQKDYDHYLHDAIYDIEMDVMGADDEKDELKHSILSAEEKLKQKKGYFRQLWNRAGSSHLKVNKGKSLKSIWIQLPEKIVFRILEFLKLRERVLLMTACKEFNLSLRNQLEEIQTLKIIQNQFSDKHIFTNADFLKNFSKSLKSPISEFQDVVSSRTFFSSGSFSKDIQILTRYLIDFQSLTDPKSIAILESKTLLLSYISDQNEVALWVALRRTSSFVSLVIKKHQFKSTEEVISAKFCTNRYVQIQTREKCISQQETNTNYKYEIYIFDVKTAIQNIFEYDVEKREHRHFQISINLSLFDTSLCGKTKLLAFCDRELEIQANSLLSHFSILKHGIRLVLYSQSKPGMIIIYNIQRRKIEAVHLCESESDTMKIIIPKMQTDCNSLTMILIDSELRLYLLKYTSINQKFDTQEIIYSNLTIQKKNTPLTKEYRKYQYGAIYNEGRFISDYLIIYQNNEFWYVNLDSCVPKRVSQTRTLEKCSVNSWCVFEDLLAVMYEQKHLVIFKITPEGDFKELTKDRQPILYQSKWMTEDKLIEVPLKYSKEFEVMKLPPCLFMNHSYLMIIEFPSYAQGCNIYCTSLPEILMDKKVSIQSYLYLNLNKAACQIESPNLFYKDPREFFKQHNQLTNYENIVKFEGNKMLLMFERMNLFFDFDSSSNNCSQLPRSEDNSCLSSYDICMPPYLKSSSKTEPGKIEKLRSYLDLYPKISPNDNHSKSLNPPYFGHKHVPRYIKNGTPYDKSRDPLERVPNTGEEIKDQPDSEAEIDFPRSKKSFRTNKKERNSIDEDDGKVITGFGEEINFPESKQTLKQERKATIKKVKKKVYRYQKTDDYIILTFNLHSVDSYGQKEWYLRRIRKRKTKKERTYNRDLRMVKGEF